jgi:predicted acetyltransferase
MKVKFMKVVRMTKTEFELEDGRVYDHPVELEDVPSLEDFQEVYDEWVRKFQDMFVRDDVNFLIKQFNKLGFKATINKGSKNKDKEKGYIVRILVESTEPLLQYIGPCPKEIDSIYGYKWQYNT